MQKRSFTAGGFSPDRGKREEMASAVRANPAEPGRWGGRTRRQNGAVRWTAGQSGRTGRRTRRQNRAAGRSGKTERQKKRGRAKPGHRSGQVRGRRPHKQKNGIPTAGSRRTAKKRTEKQPGICKRPTHRFSIRCSDTGKGAILSAAVSKIIERNFSIFLHSDHSFQAHSRPLPWSFPFPELCPEAERVSVSANLRRHRAAFDLRFSILCTISHKILFYDVFTGFSRHAPTHVYGAARIHGAAPQ